MAKIEKRKRVQETVESEEEMSEVENLDDISASEVSDNELNMDDELDISNEQDEDDSQPQPFQNSERTSRMRTEDDKKPSFTSAIQRLLEKPVFGKPILSKNTIEKRIDEKKLEAQAKKVIKLVKVKVSNREIPVVSEYDRQMRKIATRGGKYTTP
jgi:hypothetical protein